MAARMAAIASHGAFISGDIRGTGITIPSLKSGPKNLADHLLRGAQALSGLPINFEGGELLFRAVQSVLDIDPALVSN